MVIFTNGLQNRKHSRFLPEHFNAEIFGKLKSWYLGGLHLCPSHSLSLSHPYTHTLTHSLSLIFSQFLLPSYSLSLSLFLPVSFSLLAFRSPQWPFLLTRSAFSKLSQANFNLERLLMTTSNFLISKSLKCFSRMAKACCCCCYLVSSCSRNAMPELAAHDEPRRPNGFPSDERPFQGFGLFFSSSSRTVAWQSRKGFLRPNVGGGIPRFFFLSNKNPWPNKTSCFDKFERKWMRF